MDQTNQASPKINIKGKEKEKSKQTFNWLRFAVHFIGLFPLLDLAYKSYTNQLTVNPIQYVEQFLGRAALNMLVVSLAITPLITISGWKKPGRHRRALGLYAFFYFALHFITFAVVDYGLDVREIFRLTTEKPFIIVGSLAGFLLLLLAVTSFKFWMKFLGKNWKRLHKLVYVISVLVILHYAWAVKGSISTLSGDIGRPILMGSIVLILLFLRIPPIKQWIINRRKKS
ncbi:MAG: protein-methionine-sulfoxide reductase heme-binding subunit MsrQ [Anaerolineaceae bacterium]|nr:protein-methionine-sulfoxide reductase heme-binding subunit MsrQ [Anaerolineaceae bacterium]